MAYLYRHKNLVEGKGFSVAETTVKIAAHAAKNGGIYEKN